MEIKDEQEPTHHVKRLKQLMFYVLFYVIILRHGLGYSFECLSIYTKQDFLLQRDCEGMKSSINNIFLKCSSEIISI